MKDRMRKYLILFVLGWSLFFSANSVSAKKVDTNKPQGNVTFTILPEIPKDNIGGPYSGYFNLKISPKKERQIRIKIMNPTKKALVVTTSVHDGLMDDTVTPMYSQKMAPSKLQEHPFSRQIKMPARIKLAAGASKWVTITIKKGPKFAGQKVAAIDLISVSHNAGAIQNRFVYTVAIIGQGHKLSQYQKIDTTSIETKLIKKKPAIAVHLKNPDPVYLMKGTLKVSLVNKKWQFFKYENTKRNVKIVPSVYFKDNVYLGQKRLVPGVYRLKLSFKSVQYKVSRYRYVEITKDQARYINEHNAEYLLYRNQILMVSAGIILITLFISYYIWKRKRMKNDENIV